MNGTDGKKLPPWYDEERHEVDPDTGVVKKKGYKVIRGSEVAKLGEKLVMDKIARVERETREREKKEGKK